LVQGEDVILYPPFAVDAVDPTGAGDTFSGALAASLSQGRALDEAVRFATAAGALAAKRAGAQAGMPVLQDVEALLDV
jgi:ribokinase